MTSPQPTEIPGLFILPLPTPFPIGRINTFVARGDTLTLIDTGVNSARSYDELVEGLAALGAAPADLDRVIITHHHTDHLGLVDRLAAESGAEIWCHARCVPFVEQAVEARQHLFEWSRAVWREGGVPSSLLDVTGQLFEWLASLSNGPVPVTRVLHDGDVIDLLGTSWTVLHTPGHAGDLIGLLDSQEHVLLASDHLLRDVSSNALAEPPELGGKRPRRLLEYMVQLQRVADLGPRLAYGGHGQLVTDVPGLVASRLAFHRDRAEHILALVGNGIHSLWEITELMFAHVAESEKFLALSEVLGHLDWLERDGRIVRVSQGDLTCWRAA
jgi:glyoxylase-like metal-dependent hydrolase (beta-lactamase superfamily II)